MLERLKISFPGCHLEEHANILSINVVFYRYWYDLVRDEVKVAHAFVIEQFAKKDGDITNVYDVLILPRLAKQPAAELKKFIRLDMNHCLYLTTEKEVFLTENGNKQEKLK